MSRITAPLLSFNASGAIAKTQVYSKWKGLPYVRQYVVPANPKSTEQMKTRDVFSWLNSVWKFAPAEVVDAFAAFASGQPLTDRNAFQKKNLPLLRTATAMTDFIFSPGAKSGLPAASVSAADGTGSSVVTITAPTLPVGWTIDEAIAAGIKDQDPHSGTAYEIVSGTDPTATYSITLSGLSAGTWWIGGWFRFVKPDGSFAYGPSLNDSAVIS